MKYSVWNDKGDFLTYVEAFTPEDAIKEAKDLGHDDASKSEEVIERDVK